MKLSGLRVYQPPELEDHALFTTAGVGYSFTLNEPDYVIGSRDTEMIGFGPGTWLPASGFTYTSPGSKTYELIIDTLRWRNGVRPRIEGIASAMPTVAQVWRPDGQLLEVSRAIVEAKGYNSLEATFFPTGPNWKHPLLDRTTAPPPYALEANPELLIVNTKASTVLRAPFLPKRLRQGTLTIGVYCDEPALYSAASIGATISPQGATNNGSVDIFYSLGTFYAHAFGARVTFEAPQKKLYLFALSWYENRSLQLYSMSDEGFTVYGPEPLGVVPNFSAPQVSAGYIDGVGGIKGTFIPGAPRLGSSGVPFVSPRYLTQPEVEEGLGQWYRRLSAISSFTPTPVVPAISFAPLTLQQLAIGAAKDVLITVQRKGGVAEAITLTAAPDSLSLRASNLVEVVDSDFTTDIFKLTLTPEQGLTLGDHSVALTATTASGLRSTATLDIRILSVVPGLPANTTHFWAIFDPANKSLTTLSANNVSTGATGNLVLTGLVRPSSAFDALVGDGTNFATYGPSIITVDGAVTMSTDHTASLSFWDVDKLPVNSVLFSMASQTNKFDFWQVYKDTRLRVSKGTGTQTVSTSGGALSTPAGVLDLSVKCPASGNVVLENPTLNQTATLANPGLSGSGRLTIFGTKLSDGAVQGLSTGTVLIGGIQTGITAS